MPAAPSKCESTEMGHWCDDLTFAPEVSGIHATLLGSDVQCTRRLIENRVLRLVVEDLSESPTLPHSPGVNGSPSRSEGTSLNPPLGLEAKFLALAKCRRWHSPPESTLSVPECHLNRHRTRGLGEKPRPSSADDLSALPFRARAAVWRRGQRRWLSCLTTSQFTTYVTVEAGKAPHSFP